jgi:membrane-bound lytic murein transglycosylase A
MHASRRRPGWAGAALCGLLAGACAPVVPPDRAALEPVSFADLPGWDRDDPRGALAALARSCGRHLARAPDAAIGPRALAGRAEDWRAPCEAVAAGDAAAPEAGAARALIEAHFRPFAVVGTDGREGLFTGYYEPELKGARERSARYRVPLYRRPGDLVMADLGVFSEEFRGRTIAGRVTDGRLVPYHDRAGIAEGGLAGRGLELVWVDDPVDAFFLEIQGSGRVVLEDGSVMRLGYAGKNGHRYTAIGRVLMEMGALDREEVSMQSIRAWLAANPEKAREVMARNRSYVFFRELAGEGPIGAEGVVLTPGRSLAVDRRFLPLGVPLYVAAEDPAGALAPVEALMVAQDTGGAIRGPVRGDVFLGAGPGAAERAGRMRFRGRAWLLLPAALAARIPAS